jgi:hypothetical protein
MREHHRRARDAAARRVPQQASNERTVVGDDPHALTYGLDTGVVLGERPEPEPERPPAAEVHVEHHGTVATVVGDARRTARRPGGERQRARPSCITGAVVTVDGGLTAINS